VGKTDAKGGVMEISEYQNIYLNERTHFFYLSTHYLVEKLIRKYAPGAKTILDAGCGTGGLMKKLKKLGRVCGIDLSPEAIKFAKKKGVVVKKASILNIPHKAHSFDVVTSVDVIYHLAVTNDLAALKEMRRVLKPSGILILRVPANKFLLSAHDKHVHTARRYEKKELVSKLRRAGFKAIFVSYVHSLVFPLSLLRVTLEKITHKQEASTVEKINPTLNWFIGTLLKLEADLITRGVSLPFGQGLIAVASPSRQNIPGQKKQ
jgi:SAM-dependent methyltransferase